MTTTWKPPDGSLIVPLTLDYKLTLKPFTIELQLSRVLRLQKHEYDLLRILKLPLLIH